MTNPNRSLVIDHLRLEQNVQDSALVFAYFDYRDQESQSAENVTASFLKQAASTRSSIPKAILDAFRGQGSPEQGPHMQDLERMFLQLCREIGSVFIVVDALDECDEMKHRKTFLNVLTNLCNVQEIKLFLTSRNHPRDIRAAFESAPQIPIGAHEVDLRRFLNQQIENSGDIDIIDPRFKIEIIEKIVSGAGNM